MPFYYFILYELLIIFFNCFFNSKLMFIQAILFIHMDQSYFTIKIYSMNHIYMEELLLLLYQNFLFFDYNKQIF